MSTPNWAPPEIDVSRPSAARVYDYYLGGSHNFEVDRQMAEEAIRLWPELPRLIRSNRAFLRRAVSFLASQGVDQFLDIGSGIPTVGNVHEVARRAAPDARVVYVDRDPVAVAHSRALLADVQDTTVLQADLRRPEEILDHPDLASALDLGRPVALLLVAILHFVPDEDEPLAALRRLSQALAPGSFLVLSHASPSAQADKAATHQQLYQRTPTPMTMRTEAEIARFFDGFDLIPPGLVPLALWRPDEDAAAGLADSELAGHAGVGRKR
jgi:SAM-dependent methyltransferase